MATELDLQYVISADSTKLASGMAAAEATVVGANAGMAESAKAMEAATVSATAGISGAFAKMAGTITGANSAVAASSTEAAASMHAGFKNAATGIQGSMGGISKAFDLVKGNLLLLSGILAGGAAFKEAIGATNEWNGAATKLSKQLGISTQDASVYMVALHKFGIESDTLGVAVQKVALQIMKGGQGFKTLGVDVKDSAGQFKPAMDIIVETNNKIKEIHNPILQAQAGMSAYGRSWADIKPLLKLTGAELEEAAKKAKLLNLEVSAEQAANSKKYKENMKEFGLALQAISINIGQAILPAFAKLTAALAEVAVVIIAALRPAFDILAYAFEMVVPIFKAFWATLATIAVAIKDGFGAVFHSVFGEDIPKDIDYVAGVVNAFKTFFVGFKVGMLVAFEAIGLGVNLLKANFVTFVNVAERALHMDFAGAKAEWSKGAAAMEAEVKASAARIVKIAADGKKQMDDVWAAPKAKTAPKKSAQELDPDLDFSKKKADSIVKGFETELALQKAHFETSSGLEGRYIEFSKQQEQAFWESKLKTLTKGSDDYKAVQLKIAMDRIAIAKKAFDVELAEIRNNEAEYKNNTDMKLQFANEYLDKVTTAYGSESVQFAEAQKHIIEIKRQAIEQLKAVDLVRMKAIESFKLDQISAEEDLIKLQQSLGLADSMTTLKADQEFEDRRYEIRRRSLEELNDLAQLDPDSNPVEVAKINAELESLELAHRSKMRTIDNSMTMERQKNNMSVIAAFQHGMATMIKSVATGTATVGQAMKSFMLSMADAVIGILAEMAAKWVATKIAEMIIGKTAAISGVASNAAVAGSAAVASAAAIPMIGWAMAPAAGAEAFAAAMAFGAVIPAAAKGFDIPAGLNPITQLHEKEMVLPAQQADVIRDMADSGGSGGRVELHVHATDAQSVKRLFENNGAILADVLKKQQRNFKL